MCHGVVYTIDLSAIYGGLHRNTVCEFGISRDQATLFRGTREHNYSLADCMGVKSFVWGSNETSHVGEGYKGTIDLFRVEGYTGNMWLCWGLHTTAFTCFGGYMKMHTYL